MYGFSGLVDAVNFGIGWNSPKSDQKSSDDNFDFIDLESPNKSKQFDYDFDFDLAERIDINDVSNTEQDKLKISQDIKFNQIVERNDLSKSNSKIFSYITDMFGKQDEITTNLPIGIRYNRINSLQWKRNNSESDFEVIYKGSEYSLSHIQIEQIMLSAGKNPSDIDDVLKLFIENKQNANDTIIQLIA
jgi:hypothetical protein